MRHSLTLAGRRPSNFAMKITLQALAATALTVAAISPVLGQSAPTSPVLMAASDGTKTMSMDKAMTVGDLELTGLWTRAMLPGQKAGGGFLIVSNTGSEDDRLVGFETKVAGKAEVHTMKIVDDVMKMRPLADGIVIPAGETVELKPGGLHLMFMAVTEPFAEGGTVPVTLIFEKAGKLDVDLTVMPANTKGGMKGHKHSG